MPPEINALLDKPLLLFIILAIGAACGMGVERFAESMKRAERRAYWKGRNWRGKSGPTLATIRQREAQQHAASASAADQLKTVMKAQFKPRALLNKPERRLLGHIDKALADHSPGWRAMGQVSLGEILYSPDKDAYWAVNAKRVDLLIIDADCHPLHAIEFQGTGHHASDDTAARDAVKKEALRRAGIGYVEVVTGDTPAEVREMVRKLVGRSMA